MTRNKIFLLKKYLKNFNKKHLNFLSIVRTSEINDIGKMPTNCADLERMGHVLSGFFSVKGSKKIETVYCDFYPNQNGTTATACSRFLVIVCRIFFFFFLQSCRNGSDMLT
jgi:hypothetical protein